MYFYFSFKIIYNFFTYLTFFFFVVFLVTPGTPLDGFHIVWTRIFSPRLVEYLRLNAKLRPVTAVMSPIIFVVVLSLLFLGFLPYSVEVMMNWKVVFFLSFSCWFAAFLHMIRVKRFSLYMVKQGYPLLLRCFLVWIELIREFSKPFSLGIRLYANLVFGHYLLLGVWWVLDRVGVWSYPLSVFFVLFELAVFVIQSYIFTVLVTMYFGE